MLAFLCRREKRRNSVLLPGREFGRWPGPRTGVASCEESRRPVPHSAKKTRSQVPPGKLEEKATPPPPAMHLPPLLSLSL